MAINRTEWERHRDNMYQSLTELLQQKHTDSGSYEYTCRIMAFTFDVSVDTFMHALESENTFSLATRMMADEYGEIYD